MINKIMASIRIRLKAYSTEILSKEEQDAKKAFLTFIDSVMSHHGLKKRPSYYPKEYYLVTDETTMDKVKKDLEKFGLKFAKFAANSPNAKAVEAIGKYKNVEYIVDIVLHGSDLRVDVYF